MDLDVQYSEKVLSDMTNEEHFTGSNKFDNTFKFVQLVQQLS